MTDKSSWKTSGPDNLDIFEKLVASKEQCNHNIKAAFGVKIKAVLADESSRGFTGLTSEYVVPLGAARKE